MNKVRELANAGVTVVGPKSLAVAVVVASPGAVEALADGEQQGFGGGGERFVGSSGGTHGRSRLRVKRAAGVGPAWVRG